MIGITLLALSLAAAGGPPAGRSAIATDGLFQCAEPYIRDGNGLMDCGPSQKILLQGIVARPENEETSAVLAAFTIELSISQVHCIQVGERAGLAVAWCTLLGGDLACEMIREGVSARDPANDPEGRLRACVARP